MSEDKIKEVLTRLGLRAKDISLYVTAFTHQSYANEHRVESNERLEYLGDAILDFLVAEYFSNRKFPDFPEGKLTRIRAKYVCAKANSSYARQIGLDECLLLGRGEEEQGGKSKPSLLGDLFEAFVGAVYLDSGLEAARGLLAEIVFPKIGAPDSDFFMITKAGFRNTSRRKAGRASNICL